MGYQMDSYQIRLLHMTQRWHCPEYGKHFASVQCLMTHRSCAYNYVHSIHRVINDVLCPVCMLNFHKCTRLLSHLRYRSHVCRSNLLLFSPIISEEETRLLEEDERAYNRSLYAKGIRSHAAQLLVFRLVGPLTM